MKIKKHIRKSDPKKTSHRRSHRADSSDGEFLIESEGAVMEYIRRKPQGVVRVDLGPAGEKLEAGRELVAVCKSYKIPVFKVSNDVCSGFRAAIKIPTVEFEDVNWADQNCILVLDHIQDARNLGAIVRSAAFFGVGTIVVAKDRQAAITQAGVATAAGGFARVDVVAVTNITRTLRELKNSGYWILGTDGQGEKMDEVLSKLDRTALVLGAEDKGMSRLVREVCDSVVSISGSGGVESLNVSVAAGILMHRLFSCKK